jgi:hypothetical protein
MEKGVGFMKIALCLSGYTGFKGKMEGDVLDLNIAYKHYESNVIGNYDVDTYIHSWSIDSKNEILETYKPKDYIIEKQLGKEVGILDAGYSQWYAKKKVINLMLNSGVKYDWVVLGRFDVAIMFQLQYEKYDNTGFYAPGERRSNALNDLYFMTNMNNMEYLMDLFDNLGEEGYDVNHKSGTMPGGLHFVLWHYLQKNKDIKIKYLGTDKSKGNTVADVQLIRGL